MVDGWRNDAQTHGLDGDDGFSQSGRAQQMAQLRFVRRHGNLRKPLAEQVAKRSRLRFVVGVSTGRMGADMRQIRR